MAVAEPGGLVRDHPPGERLHASSLGAHGGLAIRSKTMNPPKCACQLEVRLKLSLTDALLRSHSSTVASPIDDAGKMDRAQRSAQAGAKCRQKRFCEELNNLGAEGHRSGVCAQPTGFGSAGTSGLTALPTAVVFAVARSATPECTQIRSSAFELVY